MTDGNRRLKKLFRSSKPPPGAVDPLASPDPASAINPNTIPASSAHAANTVPLPPVPLSSANLRNTIPAAQPVSTNPSLASNGATPIHEMRKRRQQPTPPAAAAAVQYGVTPFPMDAGRPDPAPPRQEPVWDVRPSLADMAQMEENAASAPYRRDQMHARSRSGTENSLPPLPIDNPWPVPAPSEPSPISQPSFFLPPGAGPPSPQIRDSTPPSRMMQSTPSLHSGLQLPPPQPPAAPAAGAGAGGYTVEADLARGRGYSTSSQEGHMGSVSKQLTKPIGPNRSPLGSAFSEPQVISVQPAPLVQHYTSWQSTPMGSERSTPRDDAERYDARGRATPNMTENGPDKPEREKEKKRFWASWGQPKNKDKGKDAAAARDREAQAQRERDAQAQRDRDVLAQRDMQVQRDMQAQRELEVVAAQHGRQGGEPHGPPLVPPVTPFTAQMARMSLDDSSLGGSHEPSRGDESIGHGAAPGSAGQGGMRMDMPPPPLPPPEGNGVDSAIRKLAGSRETTQGAVLDVCARVNASNQGEAVGKEAARTLRKILKSGADNERRMALRMWLIAMRTITVPRFQHYASNRKFMAAVEPIMTQTLKPPPSTATFRTCRDILMDLTFCYYQTRGCEGLYETWKKVRQPGDPEFGARLPDDYLKHGSSASTQPSQIHTPGNATPVPVAASAPAIAVLGAAAAVEQHSTSPGTGFGPPYSSLPDHHEDMMRLIEECNAAKEAAHVLSEALVYTRPEELEHKGVIKEFYTKCVLAHESLTNQMEWASSEANKSRRVVQSIQAAEGQTATTVEESALALLFEAHGALTDSLRQHDELEKMAMDDREMRAVQERSKKDTRMDRRQQMDMLMVGDGAQASSSRSPSPALRSAALPDDDLYRADSRVTAAERASYEVSRNDLFVNSHLSAAAAAVADEQRNLRTPSPDAARRALHHPHPVGQPQAQHQPQQPQSQQAQAQNHQATAFLPPPMKMSSPTRTDSPVGRRIPGPRPLPNPFRSVNSSQNLQRETSAVDLVVPPSGSAAGVTEPSTDAETEQRPSRKALGKRRADPDNDFDPDDMFKTQQPDKGDAASDHSFTAHDLYLESLAKPTVYAYDAWAESEQVRRDKERLAELEATAADGRAAIPAGANLMSSEAPTVAPHSAMRGIPGDGDARPVAAR